MYENKTEIGKFKTNLNLKLNWYNFCWGNISNNYTKDEQSAISVNGPVYDFPVDSSSVKKEDIPNIHQYLIVKNNKK